MKSRKKHEDAILTWFSKLIEWNNNYIVLNNYQGIDVCLT